MDNWSTNQLRAVDAGRAPLAPSPVALDELELLKKTVFFTRADEGYLRRVGDALADPWSKAVILQVALWSYVYAKEGDW